MYNKPSKIAVLVSARRNSKYLAKFLFGLYERTMHPMETPVCVMLNDHDTWNSELANFMEFVSPCPIKFYRENMQLGRAGLHKYFNELVKTVDADWYIYFCEDHFITMEKWDEYIRDYIEGNKKSGDSKDKPFPLNPNEPWVLVPKFDNCGAMNHIVSRGFIRALGGVIGNHGWIDSYVNDLMAAFPDRVIRMDDEMFHDFTHDNPSPMSEAHIQSLSTEKGKHLPKYEDARVKEQIKVDQDKIKKYLEGKR